MSTTITTLQVKELRDSTGISVMQCKRALEEADGDMEKALAILKKTSSDIALKKVNREVKAGKVSIKSKGTKTILLSLLCETDFVAKNDDFTALLIKLTENALNDGIESMKKNAKELIDSVIQKTGENIQLGEVYETSGNVIGNYVHNDKIGVIVSLEGGSVELAKDIAMHITAMKPEYISKDEITSDAKKMMEEVFQKEVSNINKPEDIKKKMLDGKMSTYFKERTLLDQIFIKGEETVGKLLEKSGAKIKETKIYSI